MRKELEKELTEIDPVFFEELIACENGEMDQMSTCMYWGLECGDGWFMSIADLVSKTAFLNKILKDYNTGCKLVAVQIKEKFAELTIYESIKCENVKELTEDQEKIVDMVQKIYHDLYSKTVRDCYYTCEICGHKNDKKNPIVTTKVWLSRICKECAEQNKKEYRLDGE